MRQYESKEPRTKSKDFEKFRFSSYFGDLQRDDKNDFCSNLNSATITSSVFCHFESKFDTSAY